jgi:hypothetical protein
MILRSFDFFVTPKQLKDFYLRNSITENELIFNEIMTTSSHP